MRPALLFLAVSLAWTTACFAATLEGRVASVEPDGRAFLLTTRSENGHFDERKILVVNRTSDEGVGRLKEGLWLAVDTGPVEGDETPGTLTAVSLRPILPLDGQLKNV